MSLKIDRAELEVVIKSDKARQKMIELEEKMKDTRKQLKLMKKLHGEESKEYKEQAAILRDLKQQHDNVVESIGLENLSVKELARRSKELNQILNSLNPNAKGYDEYKQQLKEVNLRLKELKGTARDTRFSFEKLADGFNRYAGIAAGAVASMTGIVITGRKCVDEYAEMEEAMAQVIKYTSMTVDGVDNLNDSFKNMDTRTTREGLNALAADAGRLGIKGSENIRRFVETANMIRVALGEDLGEDAIKQIGKLAEIFAPGAELDEGMTRIGSAINHVAQNSSAAERYLVDFTARMGGTGQQARMAVTDIMGFASALDQNMIRNEMASTALQKVIMNIYKEPAKFAKFAQQDVTKFTNLVRTDANEAVLVFLEGLSKLGGMANLAPVLDEMKLEGTEAAGVVASLAANVAKVRKEQKGAAQAFAEGTSILNEYTVQNSTVQAEIEKSQKKFKEVRVELGEKLQPIMKYMITTGSASVKMLAGLVTFLTKYGKALAVVTVAVGAYTAGVKLSTLATKLDLAAKMKQITALNWITIKTKAAAAAQAALNLAMKANPAGVMLSMFAGLITYLGIYEGKAKEAAKSQSDFNRQLSRTKDLNDEDNSVERIKARYKNLAQLDKEQRNRLKTDAQTELDLLKNQLADKEAIYKEEARMRAEKTKTYTTGQKKLAAALEEFNSEQNDKSLEILRNQIAELEKITAHIPDNDNVGGSGSSADSEDMQKLKKNLALETELLDNQYALNLMNEENYQKKLYDIRVRFLTKKIELLKEEGRSTSAAEDEMLSLMTMEANRKYLDNRMNGIGEDRPQKPITEHGIIEEDTPDEDNYIIEKFKNSEEGKLALLEAYHDAGVISEEEYQDRLNEIHRQKMEERSEMTKAGLQAMADLAGGVSQLMGAMQEGEIRKISRKYDQQIKAAKKAGKDTTKLEEEKEAEIAAVKKKYADKQFAMAVLQITSTTAITAMEAYKAMAGIPVVGPALGAAAAAAAVVAGGAQIAIAKQQRDEAKGLYEGGYSEGYTERGNPHEVAGVIPVHKNEFVTNHEGVANPHVRQFLDVFDVAQKNGTIGMINTTQILERIKYTGGKFDGGYTGDRTDERTIAGEHNDFAALLQMILAAIRGNGEYLSELADKELKVDVRAVRDGMRHIDQLEKNARR